MDENTQTIDITVVPAPVTVTAPTGWSQCDEDFFRVVAGLLSPSYLAGAGALLASYDED